MAHFAEIDDNNIVIRVVVTNNSKTNEGYDWLVENLGGRWVKTSYNTYAGQHLFGGEPIRKNFAGIGYSYDEERDAFIPPKPYSMWILDEETCLWQPPIPYPNDGKNYIWDDENNAWLLVESE